MWCPKCKTEYIDGITKCADCGVDLVEELPATSYDDLSGETREKLSHIKAVEESKSTLNPKEGSTRYIDKRSQYEEMKSSAYTFLFVGVLGILAMILIALDLIPLHACDHGDRNGWSFSLLFIYRCAVLPENEGAFQRGRQRGNADERNSPLLSQRPYGGFHRRFHFRRRNNGK